MKVDITYLLNEVGNEKSVEFSTKLNESLSEDCTSVPQLEVQAKLMNTGMGILVQGTAQAQTDQVCAICCKSFSIPIEVEFEERFVHGLEGALKTEDDNDDLVYYYDSEEELDLTDMIREQIILNLPIAPKCDINCKVKNSNQKKDIDPRLSILKKLKA